MAVDVQREQRVGSDVNGGGADYALCLRGRPVWPAKSDWCEKQGSAPTPVSLPVAHSTPPAPATHPLQNDSSPHLLFPFFFNWPFGRKTLECVPLNWHCTLTCDCLRYAAFFSSPCDSAPSWDWQVAGARHFRQSAQALLAAVVPKLLPSLTYAIPPTLISGYKGVLGCGWGPSYLLPPGTTAPPPWCASSHPPPPAETDQDAPHLCNSDSLVVISAFSVRKLLWQIY